MTKEEGEKKLKDAGFGSNIIYWHDAAGTINAEHTHPTDISVVVLSGEIEVVIFNIKDVHHEGDLYQIQANVPHHSTIGPQGCEYMVGKPTKPGEAQQQ